MHTCIQTTCERKCLANFKRVCICALYSDPPSFMLSHWQLWVIAPCSSAYPWTTFNYVTKCTCSASCINVSTGVLNDYILSGVVQGMASLNHKKACLLILWDKLTPWYLVMWVRDYPFVLYMIRNLKIISSKAVECLQKLKRRQQGSWSLFLSFFFFEERKAEMERWQYEWMNPL